MLLLMLMPMAYVDADSDYFVDVDFNDGVDAGYHADPYAGSGT